MGWKIIDEYGHIYIKFFISLAKTMVQAPVEKKKKKNKITNKVNTLCPSKFFEVGA